MAVAALILGIAGCCLIGPLGSIPAIILGIMAKNQIQESPNEFTPGSKGMATWGVVLGIVGLVFFVLWILVIVVAFGGFIAFLAEYTQYCEDNPEAEECQDQNAVAPGLFATPPASAAAFPLLALPGSLAHRRARALAV